MAQLISADSTASLLMYRDTVPSLWGWGGCGGGGRVILDEVVHVVVAVVVAVTTVMLGGMSDADELLTFSWDTTPDIVPTAEVPPLGDAAQNDVSLGLSTCTRAASLSRCFFPFAWLRKACNPMLLSSICVQHTRHRALKRLFSSFSIQDLNSVSWSHAGLKKVFHLLMTASKVKSLWVVWIYHHHSQAMPL